MSIRQGGNTIAGAVGKYPLNERNISNCITEIPQDIKLELNNGTLTLKAGSKVYVPNGAGVFDELTIANDLTLNGFGTGTRQMIVCYRNTQLDADPNSFSGTSTPSGSGFFYNTSTNKIDFVSSGTALGRTYSFPLCVVTFVDSAISSIDQVFNGFGYIGSTVYALPGVKGLIPDGRNEDGTLYNVPFTVSNVLTGSVINYTGVVEWLISDNNISASGFYKYDSVNNYNTHQGSATQMCVFASSNVVTTGEISNWKSKTAFHAVNYSDTEYIAHQSMPSSRYDNLTLGANGSTYTAPADGWFCLSAIATNTTSYVTLNVDAIYQSNTGENTDPESVLIPAKKGAVATIYYANINLVAFRFVYANGVA